MMSIASSLFSIHRDNLKPNRVLIFLICRNVVEWNHESCVDELHDSSN